MKEGDSIIVAEWAAHRCLDFVGNHLAKNMAVQADDDLCSMVQQLEGFAQLVHERIKDLQAEEVL